MNFNGCAVEMCGNALGPSRDGSTLCNQTLAGQRQNHPARADLFPLVVAFLFASTFSGLPTLTKRLFKAFSFDVCYVAL